MDDYTTERGIKPVHRREDSYGQTPQQPFLPQKKKRDEDEEKREEQERDEEPRKGPPPLDSDPNIDIVA